MDFSNRLITARKAKGISQETLAESLGISRQAVSKWETGESKPDLDNLTALCTQLDVTMEYLCLGKTVPETPPQELPAKPNKRPLWTAVIAALLSMLLGFVLSFALFHDAENAAPQRDYVRELEAVKVSNVEAYYDYEQKGYGVSVLPSSVPQGMEMELLIEYVDFPDMKATTLSCQWDGYYYTGYLKTERKVRITAVFYLEEQQKQVPILDFRPQEGGFGYSSLWQAGQ